VRPLARRHGLHQLLSEWQGLKPLYDASWNCDFSRQGFRWLALLHRHIKARLKTRPCHVAPY
jgi:hypothetical protein